MSKEIFFGEEARKKLADGVDKVANAVRITLGPRGRAVVINRGVGPIFTLDGVTVAKAVELEDEAEIDGSELAKSVASDTEKEAGDGTTTAIILVQSVLRQGLRALALGIDHTKMKKGIDEALFIAKKHLKKFSKEIKTEKELVDVGTISSRDPEIGALTGRIISDLGKEAMVSVEIGKVLGVHEEIVEGYKIDKGYISPYMMTDREREECVLEDPYILVTSQVLSVNDEIVPLLQQILGSEKKSLLIVADTLKGEALATFLLNALNHRIAGAAIVAPGIGEEKTEQLKDFVSFVGGSFVSEEVGLKVEDAKLEDLGRAARVLVKKDSTVIIGGKGNPKSRIKELSIAVKTEKSDYKRESMELRIARLKGKVAVIHVGSLTDEAAMEERYRIEDAVKAAKSSLAEGIVAGGGMALYSAAKEIGIRAEKEKDLSYRTGLKIIEEAIKEPARQIILNTGESPDVVLAECIRLNKGYDSKKGEYVNLIESGIVDPAKVVRVGLEKAVETATMFLITGALITERPEKKNENNVQ